MSRASPVFTLPSEADVLPASPPIGPAVCTASLRLPITVSPARSVSPVRSLPLPSETPLTLQTSPVHSDIEILPPPPCSSVATTTASLACASPLTERALRSQRRDALRATHDAVSSPTSVHPQGTLAEREFANDCSEIASEFRARISNSHLQYSTPQRLTPVYYSTSAPCATTRFTDHLPPTVRTATPRALSPLAPLRASSSTMPSTTTSATGSTTTSTTAAPKMSTTASPARSAPLPLLDFSPTPSLDLRANTGSRTGRTPGLRPAAPLPRTFPLAITGPPPHLEHWASVWDTLTPQQRAEVGQVSLH